MATLPHQTSACFKTHGSGLKRSHLSVYDVRGHIALCTQKKQKKNISNVGLLSIYFYMAFIPKYSNYMELDMYLLPHMEEPVDQIAFWGNYTDCCFCKKSRWRHFLQVINTFFENVVL